MKFLRLSVDLPPSLRHPMGEFLRESDAVQREELVTWNLQGDADVEYALFYVVGDRERYRQEIATVESVRACELTPAEDGAFYAYVTQETREADRRWRTAFADRNLVVVPPIVYDERAAMHLTVLGDHADLRDLLDSLPDAVDVTVEEAGDYDHRRQTAAGALSTRQREAVRAALDAGYYDVPRTGDLSDVADALDCATGTASELLRRAERAVMSRVR